MTGYIAGDIPMPGDYDGDGKADPALFNPTTKRFYGYKSSDLTYPFDILLEGYITGDILCKGDFNGDGKDEIAYYRPSTGILYWFSVGHFNILNSKNGTTANWQSIDGGFNVNNIIQYDIDNDTGIVDTVAIVAGAIPFNSLPNRYDPFAFGDPGLAFKPFRVLKKQDNNDGTFNISAQEYNATIYNVDTNTPALATPNYSSLNATPSVTFDKLDEILIKKQDGSIIDCIDVYFTRPSSSLYSKADIYYRGKTSSAAPYPDAWTYAGVCGSEKFRIENVLVGYYYQVVIVTNNTAGQKGTITGSPKKEVLTRGKADPPSNVVNFKANQNVNMLTFTWDHIEDADLWGYEIRQGAIYASSTLVIDLQSANRYDWPIPLNGTYRFWIKAIDTSENESLVPASLDVTCTGVDDGLNFLYDHDLIYEGGMSGPTGTKYHYTWTSGTPGNGYLDWDVGNPGFTMGSWSAGTDYPNNNDSSPAVVLPDGRILVVGGDSGSMSPVNKTYFGTLGTGYSITWASGTVYPRTTLGHSNTVLPDGRVLVIGGFGSGSKSETYFGTLGTGYSITWASGSAFPSDIYYHSTSLLPDGRVLVVGGNTGSVVNKTYFGTIAGYSITWASGTVYPSLVSCHTTSSLPDGRILVIGGQTGGAGLNTTNFGTIAGDTITWASGTVFPGSNVFYHSATTLGGQVVVTGGWTGTAAIKTTYVAGISGNTITWSAGTLYPTNICYHSSTLLPDGRILVIGGFDGNVLVKTTNFSTSFSGPIWSNQFTSNPDFLAYYESNDIQIAANSVGANIRLQEVDDITATNVTDVTFPLRTDQSYPEDTDQHITTITPTYLYYAAYATSPATGFVRYTQPVRGDFKYFRVRTIAVSDNYNTMVKVRKLRVCVDMDDINYDKIGLAIADTGTTVTFSDYGLAFYVTPVIQATVTYGSGAVSNVSVVPVVSNLTATSCQIKLLDIAGVGRAGTVNLNIHGY
jgi:hypothetical protein